MYYINLQLDSADEQAAAIRRELDGRMQRVSEMEKVLSIQIIVMFLKYFVHSLYFN